MTEKNFKRIERPATAEERQRHADIRQQIMQEFPPAEGAGRAESPPGVPTQIRQAREAQGLTWYALAKHATHFFSQRSKNSYATLRDSSGKSCLQSG